MQHVDVLRDHRVKQAARLELDERLVCAVGPLAAERLKALAVEAPETLWIAVPRIDVGDLHRVDVRPQPRAGGAEVRDSRGHRDPGPGQRDDGPGRPDELRKARHAGGAHRRGLTTYSPFHAGWRLPRNAPMPSRASDVEKTSANAAFSVSMPSSRSASPAVVRLIAWTASGACPASLRAHAIATSCSSWSATTRVARPISK